MTKYPLTSEEEALVAVFNDCGFSVSSTDNKKAIELRHKMGKFAYLNRESESLRVWIDPALKSKIPARLPSGVSFEADVGHKSTLKEFDRTRSKGGNDQHFGLTFEASSLGGLRELLSAMYDS